MIVVSNTSPLFYLDRINHLDLLRQLYGEIFIPIAVFNEITDIGIIIAAKQRNLIKSVKPLLDSLVEQTGFWIEQKLYREVLRIVGEEL